MGYHIINNHNNELTHCYVKSYEDLIELDSISLETIIYQGEEHWIPEKVSESKEYKKLAESNFKLGMKAQKLFKEQAQERDYALEEICQDKESFKQYKKVSKNITKRCDYIVRKKGTIEVEVKCRALKNDGNLDYFTFDSYEAKKLWR